MQQAVTYNLHTSQLTIGYTPDIFGSNIHQVPGRRATRDYQRFQLEAANITLAPNLVAAALQEAGLRAQIESACHKLPASPAANDICDHLRPIRTIS
jgi:outer membrane protein TolC